MRNYKWIHTGLVDIECSGAIELLPFRRTTFDCRLHMISMLYCQMTLLYYDAQKYMHTYLHINDVEVNTKIVQCYTGIKRLAFRGLSSRSHFVGTKLFPEKCGKFPVRAFKTSHEFSRATRPDISSQVTVSAIWEVPSSLVLSCLKKKAGNADLN